MPESNERSAEWLRGAVESHINTCNLITSITSATKSHPARQGLMAAGNELHNQLDRFRALLAAAEAREALQGSKEKMALSRIHEIASRQLAEPAGAGDAVAMAKICTEVEAVQLPVQPVAPTAAEVIEEAEKALDTIKHLSDWASTEATGDLTINGVARNAIAEIARWKEANGGK